METGSGRSGEHAGSGKPGGADQGRERAGRGERAGTDPRHHLGRLGERLAGEHLERLGFEILDRNYRTRHGELDLVAFDGRTLVFCEVKTRRATKAAVPWDALGNPKRLQVRRMAASWLAHRAGRPYAADLRFDAVGITFDPAGRLLALDHLEGAF